MASRRIVGVCRFGLKQFLLLSAQLSLRFTVQWHPDVTSECATLAVSLKIIFSLFFSSLYLYFEHAIF